MDKFSTWPYRDDNASDEALAALRRKLTGEMLPEGVGNVRVHYRDGGTEIFPRVVYDDNRMDNGFLVMENDDTTSNVQVWHVCNVAWWEVIYV